MRPWPPRAVFAGGAGDDRDSGAVGGCEAEAFVAAGLHLYRCEPFAGFVGAGYAGADDLVGFAQFAGRDGQVDCVLVSSDQVERGLFDAAEVSFVAGCCDLDAGVVAGDGRVAGRRSGRDFGEQLRWDDR